jgi:hypothetical protein
MINNMNKFAYITLITFTSIYIITCSSLTSPSDDSTNDNNVTTYRLVKEIYYDSIDNITGITNYEYSNNNYRINMMEYDSSGNPIKSRCLEYNDNNYLIFWSISDEISQQKTSLSFLYNSDSLLIAKMEITQDTSIYYYNYSYNNNLLSENVSITNSDGDSIGTKLYKYVEDTIYYDSNINIVDLSDRHRLLFDENWRIIAELRAYFAGAFITSLEYYRRYSYEGNNLIEIEDRNSAYLLDKRVVYSYYDDGRIKQKEEYTGDGTMSVWNIWYTCKTDYIWEETLSDSKNIIYYNPLIFESNFVIVFPLNQYQINHANNGITQ